MAHASRSRLNCAKNEEEDEDDEKDDDGDDDVSQTEIISLLFTSLVSSWRRLKGEKERDEIEGRIEWHHLPSSHLRANEQNICGQNSALEGGTGDGRRVGAAAILGGLNYEPCAASSRAFLCIVLRVSPRTRRLRA